MDQEYTSVGYPREYRYQGRLTADYRQEYKRLKRQLEFFRILLREAGIFQSPIEMAFINDVRKELIDGFKEKNIAKTHRGKNPCRCCHYANHPDKTPSNSYDLIYILVNDPNFQLPEPDWIALRKDNPSYIPAYKCLMLGQKGCLLAENRPSVCLGWVCDGAEEAFGDHDVRNFLKKVLAKYGGRKCNGDLRQFTQNWYFKKVWPKISNSEIGKTLRKISKLLLPNSDLELAEIAKKNFLGFTNEEIIDHWNSISFQP